MQAAWVFAAGGAALAAAYTLLSGGISSSVSLLLVSIAIMATVVLGRSGMLFVTLPSVLFLTGLTILQVGGMRLPVVYEETLLRAYLNALASFTLVLTPVLRALWFSNRGLEQLQEMNATMANTREEERKRIAREIHDELGQQLTALKMRSEWVRRLIESSPRQASVETALLSEGIENAIRELRRIATQLRPGVLDTLGLIPALEWLAAEFEKDHKIICRIDLQDVAVNAQMSTVVFRAAQEALTNVAKHSGATQARMRLFETEGALQLEIVDNGRGMRSGEELKAGSFGLVGIRERAAQFQGRVDLSPAEGGGLRLALVLPLPPAAEPVAPAAEERVPPSASTAFTA